MDGARMEYAIRRLNWRPTHYGIVRMPGAVALGALPTFDEAEADRLRREEDVRVRVANPFICGPNHAARSRLPEPIFEDWLRDAGIEPPTPEVDQPTDWVGWWEQAHKRFSTEQIGHVWAGLDRVRFFEVVSRPEGSVGYAVVRVQWEYDDSVMESGSEGGAPLKVFRRWSAAEEYRREQEQQEHQTRAPDPEDDPEWGMRFVTNRWTDEALWPLGPALSLSYIKRTTFAHGHTAPFYEIVEIELPNLR